MKIIMIKKIVKANNKVWLKLLGENKINGEQIMMNKNNLNLGEV